MTFASQSFFWCPQSPPWVSSFSTTVKGILCFPAIFNIVHVHEQKQPSTTMMQPSPPCHFSSSSTRRTFFFSCTVPSHSIPANRGPYKVLFDGNYRILYFGHLARDRLICIIWQSASHNFNDSGASPRPNRASVDSASLS